MAYGSGSLAHLASKGLDTERQQQPRWSRFARGTSLPGKSPSTEAFWTDVADEGTTRPKGEAGQAGPAAFLKPGWKGSAASLARGSFCRPLHFPRQRSSAGLRRGNPGEEKTQCGPGSSVSARPALFSSSRQAGVGGTFQNAAASDGPKGLFAGAGKTPEGYADPHGSEERPETATHLSIWRRRLYISPPDNSKKDQRQRRISCSKLFSL